MHASSIWNIAVAASPQKSACRGKRLEAVAKRSIGINTPSSIVSSRWFGRLLNGESIPRTQSSSFPQASNFFVNTCCVATSQKANKLRCLVSTTIGTSHATRCASKANEAKTIIHVFMWDWLFYPDWADIYDSIGVITVHTYSHQYDRSVTSPIDWRLPPAVYSITIILLFCLYY